VPRLLRRAAALAAAMEDMRKNG